MARWEFAMDVDRDKDEPLVSQIARTIVEDIRRGRLRPGNALPGSRSLARSLGVHRLTVVAAYDELVAEGWVATEPARGTFVCDNLPDPRPRGFGPRSADPLPMPDRVPFDLLPAPPVSPPQALPPGALILAPNLPDVRLIPHELIGRAYRRALRRNGGALLGYDGPQGHEPLRVALAAMLSATRGLAATADEICITRGSQMAVALLGRVLIRPGDVVAVEALGYRPTARIFGAQGAVVVPIPVDQQGLQLERLERLLRSRPIRAVHVTPHHQFPTNVSMCASRRLRLLELARSNRFAIIEEDVDHEFHYDGRPVLPLASADRRGGVAYVGTFSKVLAPAMRIGYVVAPRQLTAALAAHRLHIDVQGDRVLEASLADLIEAGEVQRHIRRVRREYQARRDVLVETLRERLGDAVRFRVPRGGVGLWVETQRDDIEEWARRARARGALIATAKSFAVDGRPRPFARLGFASLDHAELREAVRRLAAARPRA